VRVWWFGSDGKVMGGCEVLEEEERARGVVRGVRVEVGSWRWRKRDGIGGRMGNGVAGLVAKSLNIYSGGGLYQFFCLAISQ